jgi:hypothetical protein
MWKVINAIESFYVKKFFHFFSAVEAQIYAKNFIFAKLTQTPNAPFAHRTQSNYQ